MIQTDALELRTIIMKCDQGKDMNNLQIRGTLIAIASILENHLQSTSSCKCSPEKQSLQKEFQDKLDILRDIVETKVSSLNCKIEEIVEVYSKQARFIIQEKFEKQAKKMEQQISNLNRIFRQDLKQINFKQEQILDKYDEMDQNWKKRVTTCQTKLAQITRNIKQKIEQPLTEKQSNSKNQVRIQQIKNKMKIQENSWVDPLCFHFDQLMISQNTITAKKWAYVFGSLKFHYNDSFTVKINQVKQSFWVGVIDKRLRQKEGLRNCINWIYYVNNGLIWDGNKAQNKWNLAFNSGDTIKVQVQLSGGMITWHKNGQMRKCFCNILRQNQIEWVPFIDLFHEGDSVSIVKQIKES